MVFKKLAKSLILGATLYAGACGGSGTNPGTDAGPKPDTIVKPDSSSTSKYKMPALDKQFVLPKDGSTHDVKKDGKDLPLEALIKQNENGDGANIKIEVDGSSKDGNSISYTRIDASVPSSSFVNGERIVSKTMDLSKDYQTSTGKTAKFDGPAVVTYTVCPKPETTKEDCTTLETTVNIKQDTTPTNQAPIIDHYEIGTSQDGSRITITAYSSDAEGDDLTWDVGTSDFGNVVIDKPSNNRSNFTTQAFLTAGQKGSIEVIVKDSAGNETNENIYVEIDDHGNKINLSYGGSDGLTKSKTLPTGAAVSIDALSCGASDCSKPAYDAKTPGVYETNCGDANTKGNFHKVVDNLVNLTGYAKTRFEHSADKTTMNDFKAHLSKLHSEGANVCNKYPKAKLQFVVEQ